jgi:L-cysteine desulfidase
MRLQELTGYESGVVIFKESEEGFITNWSGVDGIPRLFATGLIGFGDGDDLEKVNNSEFKDFALELAEQDMKEVLEDGGALCNDELSIDEIWENESVVVFTFKGWN